MALFKYLKPKDNLPDPKGSLSSSLRSSTIASANREVEAELIQMEKEKSRKRGSYRRQVKRAIDRVVVKEMEC